MTKFIFVILLLPSQGLAQSMNFPQGKRELFPEIDLRLFKKFDDFSLISDLRVRRAFSDRTYVHGTLGLRRSLTRHFKLGLFYRGQINNRNNDNWVMNNGQWIWNEDTNGIENIFYPELLFRFMSCSVVRSELRARWEYNSRNGNQTLRLRKNWSWFIEESLTDQDIAYLQYEAFLPLNFADVILNQQWVYLGYLMTQSSGFQYGVSLAFAEWIWTTSPMMQTINPAADYKISEQALLVSFHGLFRL